MAMLLAAGLMTMMSLVACSFGKTTDHPVEGEFIVIWDRGAGPSFDQHFTDHLTAKFPNATFEETFVIREFRYLGGGRDVRHPLDVYDIAEKDLPGDLIMFESTLAPYLFKSGYLEPLDDYLNTDLGIVDRMDSRAMEFARQQGNGTLYGIPFGKDVYALYYNTAIFDELGIPYPTDGMTWDDVFELAREIIDHPQRGRRAGLGIGDATLAFSQFHLRFFDEHGMPDNDSPLWESAHQFMNKFNDLDQHAFVQQWHVVEMPFGFADGQAAMFAGHYFGDINPSGFMDRPFAPPYEGDWNLVSYPVFEDARDTGPYPAYYYLGIPKNSHKKREAFQLIAHMLTDEVQLSNSRLGLASVLRDPFWIAHFGEGVPIFQGKQLQSYFYHPREGSLDIDFDWQMQRGSYGLLLEEKGWMKDYLDYRIEKLEEVGVVSEVFGDEAL